MPFNFEPLELPEVMHITPRIFPDPRGYFLETFKESDFAAAGIAATSFVQTNHSYSTRNVVRGLHFQAPPFAQSKLVRAIRGRIFDVAVDVRPGSPRFGQWCGRELDAETRGMLYIPEGFAHGFSVLEEDAEIEYQCNNEYAPDCECGIAFDDPDLNIDWRVEAPLVSDKDAALPLLQDLIPSVEVIPYADQEQYDFREARAA